MFWRKIVLPSRIGYMHFSWLRSLSSPSYLRFLSRFHLAARKNISEILLYYVRTGWSGQLGASDRFPFLKPNQVLLVYVYKIVKTSDHALPIPLEEEKKSWRRIPFVTLLVSNWLIDLYIAITLIDPEHKPWQSCIITAEMLFCNSPLILKDCNRPLITMKLLVPAGNTHQC